MGRELYAAYPQSRDVFDRADDILGFSLSRLCFEGPEEELTQTVNVQPAVLVTSLAYLEVIRSEALPLPAFFAGHSLGEYTALAASGALSFEDALRLVRERGRLMQGAGELSPGGMLAILGCGREEVESLCTASDMVIANINCPGQIVISGSQEKLTRAMALARSNGTKAIKLRVSGAFHSPLMQTAREALARIVPEVPFSEPSRPIIANATARPITRAEEIKEELVSQICCCVRWQESIENMIAQGTTTFIEIGPGRVLNGLIKRISPEVATSSVNSIQSIGEVASWKYD